MKKVSLSGSIRKNVGKKDAKLMRRQGFVPSVVYGNKEQIHFSVKENDIKKIVFTPNVYIINLDVEGKKIEAILKDVQIHPVTERVLHADFQEIIEGKKVKINLPLSISGLAVGVRNGGKLIQNFRALKAESLAENLPDTINIDVTDLEIGAKIRVGDISIEGIYFSNPESAVVVAVKMARGAAANEDETTEEETEETAEETAG